MFRAGMLVTFRVLVAPAEFQHFPPTPLAMVALVASVAPAGWAET
jgi:hypothetical protein